MAEIPLSVNCKTAMQVAIEVSYKAGEILLGRFYQAKEISMKGSNDFVTNVDKESEAFIMAELAREFPDMGLLGEESADARPDERYVWSVDPDVWRSKLRLGDTLRLAGGGTGS